jgi:hypothetical protein
VIDEDAIDDRVVDAARMALLEWELLQRAVLTKHERTLFLFAFAAGMTQGVREARRVNGEA